MKVRNHLPADHPYKDSKTMRQWQENLRTVNEDAAGEEFWHNQNCQAFGTYYRMEETHPATEQEIEAWKEEKRQMAAQPY